MRVLLLLLVWLVGTGSLPLSAQESATQAAEDSLLQLIARVEDDTLRMQWYNQLRRLVIYESPERALRYTQAFGKWAKRANRPKEYAMSLFYEANSYIPMGDYERALASLMEAEDHFQQIGDVTKLGSIQNSIGAVFEATDRDSLAAVYFAKSLELFVQLGDGKRQGMALNNLSNVQYRMGNYIESKALLERALVLANTEEDVQRRQLNYANTLIALKEYADAEAIYQELLSKESVLTANHRCLSYQGIGKLYATTGRMAKAAPYMRKGLELAREHKYVEEQLGILQDLTTSYEAVRDYEQAYRYTQQYQILKDSVSSAEKDRNLVDALTKYETEKKEKEIALLDLKNQSSIAIIRQKNKTIAIVAIGLVLLAGLSGFLYWLYRKYRLQKQKLAVALHDKENLLKEIHHRVKNNLQIISSLLRLQSRHVTEVNAVTALNEGEARVNSMAIIHHHLYTQADNISQVNVSNYLDDLCHNLSNAFNSPALEVTISKAVDPLYLDVNTMVPLGLVLNELITNAYKYAFTGREKGQIFIGFKQVGEQELEIIVQDDGIGKPQGDAARAGFGSRLIEAFLRKLEATQTIDVTAGTRIQIRLRTPDNAAA